MTMNTCKFCNRPADDFCGHCEAPTCSNHRYLCLDDGEEICPDCDRIDAELEAELEADFGGDFKPGDNPLLRIYAFEKLSDMLRRLAARMK